MMRPWSLALLLAPALAACADDPMAPPATAANPPPPPPDPAPPAAPPPAPAVAAAPTFSAPIAGGTFESALHAQVYPRARACYEKRVDEDPRIGEGVVNVRVVVRPDGTTTASDLGSTLKDGATIACIVGVVSQLRWKPSDGRELDSTVPFTFLKEQGD